MADQFDELEKLVLEGKFSAAEPRVFDWLQANPNDARAWFLYGKCVTNPSQKINCFKRVLILDPTNTKAQELLKTLESETPAARQPIGNSESFTPPSSKISSYPTKFKAQTKIPRQPLMSDGARSKLILVIYGILYFLFTIILGAALLYVFSLFVPRLLEFEKNTDTIQRNWISNSDPSNIDSETRDLAEIFLNPSNFDYHEVKDYEQLRQFRTSISTGQSENDLIEFSGVSFAGQLVGGYVLQSGEDGQPQVVVMNVLFDEARIPVVYYGPIDSFHYEDTLQIEGVYIKEGNGIAAQRVVVLATKNGFQSNEDTLIMLRVAALVFLWTLLCISIFLWKLNLKRWNQANASMFSPTGIVSILLLFSFFLSGCNIDLSTTLRTDGTGITTMQVQESRENMDFLRSAPGVSGYLTAVVRDLRATGVMFEQYIEGEHEVFYLQRNFNNLSAGNESTFPLEGSWIYVQRYREGNEEVLRFYGSVDTRTLYGNTDQVDYEVTNALRSLLNEINMTYQVILPGEIVYHNGDEIGNQQVLWNIQMNETNYMVAESRFPAEVSDAGISHMREIWIGLGVVFIISTLFLIASIWVRPASNQAGRKE